MVLFWAGLLLACSVPLGVVTWLALLRWHLKRNYLGVVSRIFQEKPLFVVPRGEPTPEAEEVRFPSDDGLTLHGCYFRTPRARRGVVLFGPEFGSACWSCRAYTEHLVDAGFDVFAFEPRNQGSSGRTPGYEPLQWVTDYEVRDTQAALAYLRGRGDADPAGVGFFGISKGAGAGLIAAGGDGYVRCCATDGVFATYTVVEQYIRHWFSIYCDAHALRGLLPSWYVGQFGAMAMKQVERERHCAFPWLERSVRRLAPRPLLMIHGGADSYIKPDMARALFDRAGAPKEFWLVEGAKHNQALHVAGDEYRRRVLEFFERHLAPPPAALSEQGRPDPVGVRAAS